jgi:dolichyl-phosphate-mannose-protein mannosyltransferase
MTRVPTTTGVRPGDAGGAGRGATAADVTRGVVALGRTPGNEPLPPARRRLAAAPPSSGRLWGWLGPLLVTLLAGVLRFWRLGYPHSILFDETYYAKDAYSMLRNGYALSYVDRANTEILAGHLNHLWTSVPGKIVHPEVGKWMIAAGEGIFGMDPFGWRFASALVGTLTVLVLARLVRRLTGSTLLGCVAGLLLCFDGLEFVMSRLALLDIFLSFWLVCAVACLVADRDWGRARLASLTADTPSSPRGFGPVRAVLLRPWRIAAGACFGLACGTKWSGIYVLAAFGLLLWAWDTGARRTIGVRAPAVKALVADALPALVTLLGVAFVVYVASWTGWLLHADQYARAYGAGWGRYVHHDAAGFFGETWQGLVSLWHYHGLVYDFHTGVPDANGWSILNATHPYQSNPGGWPIINRPVGVDAQLNIKPGHEGCAAADSCLRQILLIGTPALWWGGALAMVGALVAWLGKRDWRFGVAVVGFLSAWLPWFHYDRRPIFFYYATAMIPFTVIAVTLVLGMILGPAAGSRRRRIWGAALAGGFVALVIANFAFLYPILSDQLITHTQWLERIWFTSWI